MASVLQDREILVVEDEPLLRRRIARFLEREGASCTAVESVAEARNAIGGMSFDFGLYDVHLPDGRGLDLISLSKGVAVVIMTADGGWETAVEAMKLGAADYMAKPFEMEELPLVLGRCLRERRARRVREHRNEGAGEGEGDLHFGSGLEELQAKLEKILAADRRLTERLPPVLIEGETGTGKSTFGRWLHAHGPRREKELIVVNCAALPENLAESELFGHEKGAFTDAKERRLGLFEAADGGTLFLDEIASLSLPLQAKALVAVEEGRIRRVGGTSELSVDTRLIAASNQDLRELVAAGKFREDLYHRLNLLRVRVPPLRERRDDLRGLAEHLAVGMARRYGHERVEISARGWQQLMAYDWPGNVRELRHEIERGLILGDPKALEFPNLQASGQPSSPAGEQADGDWLRPGWVFPDEGFDLEAAIDCLIAKAIEQAGGNVSAAARLLGVNRDYIRYRLKKRDTGLA